MLLYNLMVQQSQAERKTAHLSDYLVINEEFQVKYWKLYYPSKFYTLEHEAEILGTFMSLGLTRKMWYILLQEDRAQIVVAKSCILY